MVGRGSGVELIAGRTIERVLLMEDTFQFAERISKTKRPLCSSLGQITFSSSAGIGGLTRGNRALLNSPQFPSSSARAKTVETRQAPSGCQSGLLVELVE